ncbi:MAG: hypothetical protein NTV43_13010 [Methylococcales bacterium]|nr:hypothetical protein [Methylococcales bacterium]
MDDQTDNSTYPFLVPSVLQGLPLAFVSVTGSANGHYVISSYPNPVYVPSPSDPPPAFSVPPTPSDQLASVNVDAKSNVVISVWYLPQGIYQDGLGAYVDSFNVDTGQFFYDPNVPNDFVTVSPDGSLTLNANDTGSVPTTADETITAHDTILGVPFLNWTVMSSGGTGLKPTVNGKNLKVFSKTWVNAIGFFGSSNKHKTVIEFKEFYEVMSHELYPGEEIDAPRPGDPNPPQLRAALRQLEVLIAMEKSISRVGARQQTAVHTQITTSVKALTDGINKLVKGARI